MYQHLNRREGLITKQVLENNSNNKKIDPHTLHVDYPTGIVVEGTWIGPLQIDQDDMVYLLDIWRNRCAATGNRMGNVLELVRWDTSKPSLCNNLVLLGASALKKFEQMGKDSIPPDVRQTIENRLTSSNADGFYG